MILNVYDQTKKYLISEPCSTHNYEGTALSYKKDPYDAWFGDLFQDSSDSSDVGDYKESAEGSGDIPMPTTAKPTDPYATQEFKVYFSATHQTMYSSSRLLDFPSFVSSVGGNLGLFLGFSFLGICFPILELIENIYVKKERKTN